MADMEERRNRIEFPDGKDVFELQSISKPGTAKLVLETILRGESGITNPTPHQIQILITDIAAHIDDRTLYALFEYARDQANIFREQDGGDTSRSAREYDQLAEFLKKRLDRSQDYSADPESPEYLPAGEGVMERLANDPAATRGVLERYLGRGDMRLPLATPLQVKSIVEWVAGPLDADFLGELLEDARRNSVPGASVYTSEYQELAKFLDKWILDGPAPDED
jgi:hypothetical protein